MSENVTQVGNFSRAGAEQLHEMAESSEKFTAYLKFHGRMFKHAPSVTLEFFVQNQNAALLQAKSSGRKPVIPLFRAAKASASGIHTAKSLIYTTFPNVRIKSMSRINGA